MFTTFGPKYYHKHYGDPKTRVVDMRATQRTVNLIHAQTQYLGLSIKSILDLGAGTGRFKQPLIKKFRGAQYTGVEFSKHACDKYGWKQGSVTSFKSRRKFDLVLCVGVLQYICDNPTLERAFRNIGRLCRNALYLEITTSKDLDENLDKSAGDLDATFKDRNIYEFFLHQNGFKNYGCGLWIPDDAPAMSLELDHMGP